MKTYKQIIIECIIGGMIGTIISAICQVTVKAVKDLVNNG